MTSEIYDACKEGDIDLLRALIVTSPSVDINRLEINGSTALHVAASNGHVNVSRVLLYECGAQRDKKNRDGLTAYEVASTDEVRQLFRRIRFCSSTSTPNSFRVLGPRWLHTYSNASPILIASYQRLLKEEPPGPLYLAPLVVDCIQYFRGNNAEKERVNRWAVDLQSIVDESFTPMHKEYISACNYVENYRENNRIECLLQLYTLNQLFSIYLAQSNERTQCLYDPIFSKLSTVRQRFFRGQCYRGLSMTDDDFAQYHWAYSNKGSYIGTNTFCSTSTDENVAKCFIGNNNLLSVLMIFDFDESCSTALMLYKLSSELPCISQFNDEQEVLILPGTIFSVEKIQEEDRHTQIRTIYLKHFNTKRYDRQFQFMSDQLFSSSSPLTNMMHNMFRSAARARKNN